jgi:hypothetical protein
MFQRMKAAIEAAQSRHARLAVTATVSTEDFASLLDKAIERRGVKLIEHAPALTFTTHASPVPRFPPMPDRRFRR